MTTSRQKVQRRAIQPSGKGTRDLLDEAAALRIAIKEKPWLAETAKKCLKDIESDLAARRARQVPDE